MSQRMNYFNENGAAMKALFGIGGHLAKTTIEKNLLHLIYFRVSQINGCAFCLDMHSKDLRAAGETEQRLYMIAAWREAAIYTERERAALAYAEALTVLSPEGISDEIYHAVAQEFDAKELVDLTLAISTINTWNRLNIAFRADSGHYQPGMFAAATA